MKKLLLFVVSVSISHLLSAQFVFNWQQLCVQEVHYDTVPGKLYVLVMNNDSNQINYPTVQVVAPNGDTVGNPSGAFDLFAQLGHTSQAYSIDITDSTITDFSGYTFLMTDQIWDTTGVLGWCLINRIQPTLSFSSFCVFPNPARSEMVVGFEVLESSEYEIALQDVTGKIIQPRIRLGDLSIGKHRIIVDVSSLSSGTYYVECKTKQGRVYKNFMVSRK